MSDDELWELIRSHREAVLVALHADGRPQLTNVLYAVDPALRLVRISTTADRLKARNLSRDSRAAIHVSGENFWNYAVAEGSTTLSDVASTPGDAATQELRTLHASFYGPPADEAAFYAEMIANRRLVVRLQVSHVYGLIATGGRRPVAADASSSDASSSS